MGDCGPKLWICALPSFPCADIRGGEKSGGGRCKKEETPLAKDGKEDESGRKESGEKWNDGT
jgi:hypothetical protein